MKRSIAAMMMLICLAVFSALAEGDVLEDSEPREIWFFHLNRYNESVSENYEIRREEDEYVYQEDEMEGKLARKVYVDALMAMIEKYDVISWNGFSGTTDDLAEQEEERFSLDIEFMDGTYVYATGGSSFPENYSEAMDDIHRIVTWIREDE